MISCRCGEHVGDKYDVDDDDDVTGVTPAAAAERQHLAGSQRTAPTVLIKSSGHLLAIPSSPLTLLYAGLQWSLEVRSDPQRHIGKLLEVPVLSPKNSVKAPTAALCLIHIIYPDCLHVFFPDRFFWASRFLGRLCWVDLIKWVSNVPRTIFKFDRAEFLIFVLVFLSCDFELLQKRQLRRVDRQSRTGLIYWF